MSKYINREISWLSFNARVLQEAEDKKTPLIERIKFLGIFSSNLDEFFRVRVATIKRIDQAGKKAKVLLGKNPKKILEQIEKTVIEQQKRFNEIYRDIIDELKKNNIRIINEKDLSKEQAIYVRDYFQDKVRPALFPIMIDNIEVFPALKDHSIYLAVRLRKSKKSRTSRLAIIEVPSILPRFLVLPKEGEQFHIIILDDIIRNGLELIFSMFGYMYCDAYTIKLTRDAEIDLDDDITMSFYEKMSKSLKQRKTGEPVRFVYDREMPEEFLKLLAKRIHLKDGDALIPGGRYHNFKDFMKFPPVGSSSLRYEQLPPVLHRDLNPRKSILNVIKKKDVLLHFPYHTFNHIIDFLREASIDPKVTSIKITLYRVAEHSSIVNALIRAVRNGKQVTVVMELQARFDEEANIYWTEKLREEGARIIHGVPNLKVHSKVCLVTREERGSQAYYVNAATGNYNEVTARIYSDHSLLTTDKRITREIVKLFEFFENNYKTGNYRHLLVSPFTLRRRLITFINTEIKNVLDGKDAYIIIKANSMFDKGMIDALYMASNAGVKINLIIRGICSLVPGIPGQSENISVISIVDRFLEHSRIFIFCNGGDEKYFISSADWMTRNIDRRVEVSCPVYDKNIQKEIREFIDIQLKDNTKSRIIDKKLKNKYRREPEKKPVRAQTDFYKIVAEKNLSSSDEYSGIE